VILKIVPKTGPEMYTVENQQMIAKEEKTKVLVQRILRIRRCFQRSKQNRCHNIFWRGTNSTEHEAGV
jgi:hypothetical protein